MHKLTFAAAAAALLLGLPLAGGASAAPAAPDAIRAASVGLNPIDNVQFFFGGQNYCWYPLGWHGPGYYWCGYADRSGLGWGGPQGWNGWGGRSGFRGHNGGNRGVFQGHPGFAGPGVFHGHGTFHGHAGSPGHGGAHPAFRRR